MTRTTLAALVLLVHVLAGCLAPAATDAPTKAALTDLQLPPGVALLPNGTVPPLNFSLTGFIEHVGFFPLPMEEAQRRVPEGFTPVPFRGAGAFGTLLVWTAQADFEGETTTNTWVAIWAEPPRELQSDGVVLNLVILDVYPSDERLVDILAAWGFPAAVADVDLDVTADWDGMRRTGVSRTSADGVFIRLATDALGDPGRGEADTRSRYYSAEDGQIVGALETRITTEFSCFSGRATLASEKAPFLGGVPEAVGDGLHCWGFDMELSFLPLEFEAGEPPESVAGGGAAS